MNRQIARLNCYTSAHIAILIVFSLLESAKFIQFEYILKDDQEKLHVTLTSIARAYSISRSLKILLFSLLVLQAVKNFNTVARMFETDCEHGRKGSSLRIRASSVILVAWFIVYQSLSLFRVAKNWYFSSTNKEDFSSSWFCTVPFTQYVGPINAYLRSLRCLIYMQSILVVLRELASMNARVALSEEQALIYDEKTTVFERNTSLNSSIS